MRFRLLMEALKVFSELCNFTLSGRVFHNMLPRKRKDYVPKRFELAAGIISKFLLHKL